MVNSCICCFSLFCDSVVFEILLSFCWYAIVSCKILLTYAYQTHFNATTARGFHLVKDVVQCPEPLKNTGLCAYGKYKTCMYMYRLIPVAVTTRTITKNKTCIRSWLFETIKSPQHVLNEHSKNACLGERKYTTNRWWFQRLFIFTLALMTHIFFRWVGQPPSRPCLISDYLISRFLKKACFHEPTRDFTKWAHNYTYFGVKYITPVKPIIFPPFIGSPCHSIYSDRLGAHLAWKIPILAPCQDVWVDEISDNTARVSVPLERFDGKLVVFWMG